MARYNKIKITSGLNTVWLTSNGLELGEECRTIVNGLEPFLFNKTGNIKISANGTPYAQMVNTDGRGNVIEIQCAFIEKTIYDQIVNIHNSAKNANNLIQLVITGETGDFTLETLPMLPKDISFESFSWGIIKNLVLRYIST